MDKHFTEREKVELLINLVESLNRGNCGFWDDRVEFAQKQLEQIDEVVKLMRDRG